MPGFGSNARLLLNDRGQAYDQPSKSGNPNQQIPNRFADLVRRFRADGEEIRSLSFGKLRKTAGNLVRQFADGEAADPVTSLASRCQLLLFNQRRPFVDG